MPGFIDSHTHLLFPVPGAADGNFETAMHGLRATTAMQLKMRALVYLHAMARHGTTTVEVKIGSGTDPAAEMKILRVLAELREVPVEVVPSFLFRTPPTGYRGEDPFREMWNQILSEFLPRVRRRGLIEFADLNWGDFSQLVWEGCPDPAIRVETYFQVARSLGLGCKLHVDSGSVLAAAIAAARHHVASIDHLEHATAQDAAAVARSNAIATLLPCASFHSDERYARARALIEAGAPIALATNFNPHQTPSLSMQAAVSLACRRMGLTPAEAISAATINGAHALGCAGRIGSLEIGKFADLLFLNVSDYRELAHSLGANLVHMVMKRGEIVYEEGEVSRRPVEDLRTVW